MPVGQVLYYSCLMKQLLRECFPDNFTSQSPEFCAGGIQVTRSKETKSVEVQKYFSWKASNSDAKVRV
jgi:hypothetical protein